MRVDLQSLLFVKNHLEKNNIFNTVYLETSETGKQYDLLAVDANGITHKIEVKTCRKTPLKDGVNFSKYFNTSEPYLWDAAAFKHNMTNYERAIQKFEAYQNYAGDLQPNIECLPSLEHKYAYMLSASTKAKGALHPKTKFKSLVDTPDNTIYLVAASDGYIYWTKQDLINGTIAYVNVVCGETTDFRNKKRVIEYKAIIDMQHGHYVQWTPEEAAAFKYVLHPPKKK